jgi:propanol-preferring alcohol dehydrogenase
MKLSDEDIVQAQSTIVISGAAPAYELAIKATKKHGRVIAVGVPSKPLSFNRKSPSIPFSLSEMK